MPRLWSIVFVVVLCVCAQHRLDAQRLTQRFRVAAERGEVAAVENARLRLESTGTASWGDQIVTGWMGSVLVGLVAWRAFDEPNGQHSKVRSDWGYTPRAMTALCVGSFVGGTLGVWLRGRAHGGTGGLLSTALGVAIPSIPMFLQRDDPVLPLMVVAGYAPLQGFVGRMTYRLSSTAPEPRDTTPTVVARQVRPAKSDDLITSEDLARTAARNAYDAVAQLRPHWFSAARLRSPVEREAAGAPGVLLVYVGGVRYGSIESLRQLQVSTIAQLQYLTAPAATQRFGTGHPAGAIDVTLR